MRIIFALLLVAVPAAAQQAPSTTQQTQPVVRDASAVALINAAIAAAGGAPQTLCGSGTATFPIKGVNETHVVTICVSGSSSRVDLALTGGLRTRVVSGGVGALTFESGKVMELAYRNTLYEQPLYFPASLLSGLLNDPNRCVLDKGLQTVNGQSEHEVDLPSVLPLGPLQKDMYGASNVQVFFDPQSSQVIEVDLQTSSERYDDDNAPVKVLYSKYAALSGLLGPLHLEQDDNGAFSFSVDLVSLQVNPTLPANEFTVPVQTTGVTQ